MISIQTGEEELRGAVIQVDLVIHA